MYQYHRVTGGCAGPTTFAKRLRLLLHTRDADSTLPHQVQYSARTLMLAAVFASSSDELAVLRQENHRLRAELEDRQSQRIVGRKESTCVGYFLDAGANIGDSLHNWFTMRGCTIAPHQLQPKGMRCFAWPYWLPLKSRQGYCALAFEPNHLRNDTLQQAAASLRRTHQSQIEVFGKALSTADGRAAFGLDLSSQNGVGSSLQLHHRAIGSTGKKGAGPAVGQHVTTVETVDAIALVRQLGQSGVPVVLKLDIEGKEFEVLRDLIISGVLCRSKAKRATHTGESS